MVHQEIVQRCAHVRPTIKISIQKDFRIEHSKVLEVFQFEPGATSTDRTQVCADIIVVTGQVIRRDMRLSTPRTSVDGKRGCAHRDQNLRPPP